VHVQILAGNSVDIVNYYITEAVLELTVKPSSACRTTVVVRLR